MSPAVTTCRADCSTAETSRRSLCTSSGMPRGLGVSTNGAGKLRGLGVSTKGAGECSRGTSELAPLSMRSKPSFSTIWLRRPDETPRASAVTRLALLEST